MRERFETRQKQARTRVITARRPVKVTPWGIWILLLRPRENPKTSHPRNAAHIRIDSPADFRVLTWTEYFIDRVFRYIPDFCAVYCSPGKGSADAAAWSGRRPGAFDAAERIADDTA